jgi:hypothetical protein
VVGGVEAVVSMTVFEVVRFVKRSVIEAQYCEVSFSYIRILNLCNLGREIDLPSMRVG